MKLEDRFDIICINDCSPFGFSSSVIIKKDTIFNISRYEYNYGMDVYLRLVDDKDSIIGLFSKDNFKKLSEYRGDKFKKILKKKKEL